MSAKLEEIPNTGDLSRLRRATLPFLRTWIRRGLTKEDYLGFAAQEGGQRYSVIVIFDKLGNREKT